MRIAFIGTRGIPNNYGGFEQFAEFISVGLAANGHRVVVYNPHFHPYKEDMYKGVTIQPIYCPEAFMGSAAHFIYDYLSLRHAVRQGFDVIYAAGYGTLAPSLLRYNRIRNLVINMDGIEWRRSKWNAITKRVMKWCEKVTVNHPAHLVADNRGIQDYYKKDFNRDSTFIAYGADPVFQFDAGVPARYSLAPKEYYICIARLEPENNIETMLDGYCAAGGSSDPFVVIGNNRTKYGHFLLEKYRNRNVLFLGPIYDKEVLDSLRHFSSLYFHGHSVGGTNPSLLEAMATGSLVAAHDNPYNRSVLGQNAFYFSNAGDVRDVIVAVPKDQAEVYIGNNYGAIERDYSWGKLIRDYEILFTSINGFHS